MIFYVDIEGFPRNQFETIDSAISYVNSKLYMGAVIKKMARASLEKAEEFSFSYESKSTTMGVDLTAQHMLQTIIPLALDLGLNVIESEAGVQILARDTGVHQYFHKWEPHANDEHFLSFMQTFKTSVSFADESVYHRTSDGQLFQEYFGKAMDVSLKVAALRVVYHVAVHAYPHLRKAS